MAALSPLPAFLPLPALPTARRLRAAQTQPTCSIMGSKDSSIAAGLGAGVAAVLLLTAALPDAKPMDSTLPMPVSQQAYLSDDDEGSTDDGLIFADGNGGLMPVTETNVAGNALELSGELGEGMSLAALDPEATTVADAGGRQANVGVLRGQSIYLAEVKSEDREFSSRGTDESPGELAGYYADAGELDF